MTNSLTHRGPDFGGYFFNKTKGVGLGHRRLSIIDISENANQPMTSHCGRYEMVYNGEVYNFKEIMFLRVWLKAGSHNVKNIPQETC